MLGPGDQGYLLKLVAPVRHLGRDIEVFAVVGEGAVVKGLENDLHLLFEIVPVRVSVQHGRAEGLHLPGVIPAPDPEDDPAVGKVIGQGVVLGETQWVPHGRNVECAAEFQVLGDVGQVHALHQEIGQALVPFPLEVVFRHPQGVIPEPIGGLGYFIGNGERRGQFFIRKKPLIGRSPGISHIIDVDVASIKNTESFYHPYTS